MQWIFLLLFAGLIYATLRFSEYGYYAQQSHYQLSGYIRYHLKLVVQSLDMVAVLLSAAAGILMMAHQPIYVIIALICMVCLGIGQSTVWSRKAKSFKVPFHWTNRVKRLLVSYWITWVILCAILWFAAPTFVAAVGSIPAILMVGALSVSKPMEARIQAGYKHKAQTRLQQLRHLHQLRVVGITGSFGKTSSKFILGAILGAKYDVKVTPNSYNTPMGICKVVNGDLAAHHEVFVAEMGARHRGDIRELVQFVEPQYSIITAVGPMHLETMGSIENIARTKFDLARGTARDGVVVVNGDNSYCVEEAAKLNRDVLFYGIDQASHLSAYSRDIHVEGSETVFTLVLPGDGEVTCRTRLLGKHNVLNIIGAALLARRMGLSLSEIEVGIGRIEPVEHRLQLIDHGTGVLVIDDAFNSNPEGAAAALDVLGQFTQYRKWIVTPGMVELGDASESVNREFGRQMAKVCDHVVLVGKLNSASMLQGLRDAGFPEDRILVARSFKEAQNQWQSQIRPGDILLFENDLPDHLES